MPNVDIQTFTGSGQISDSNRRVVAIEFHARSDNIDSVYVGIIGLTTENSRELPPNDTHKLSFDKEDGKGSVPLSTFYGITSGSDKLDWTLIYEDR